MKAKTWFIFLVMLIISLTFGCNDVGNDINNSNQDNTYEDNDYDNSSNNLSSYSVYFYAENWSEVYMYSWDESGSNASWPGVKMSYDSDGWYKGSVNYANVIFNNNSEQTVDLVSQNGYFVPENKNFEGKYEGTWYSTKPNMSNDDGSDSGYNDDYNSDDYLEAPTLTGWYSSELKTIALNWDEIENAKSYDVYMSKTNSSSTAVYCDSETKNFIRISDNKAEKNTKYYFWVKAVNGSVYSDFSNCVEIYVSEENTNTDTDTNNPSDDNSSNEDNNTSTDGEKATIYFVGANGLGRSSVHGTFTYLSIGYIKQTLWQHVLVSTKSITVGVTDGPHKIDPGSYSVKFTSSTSGASVLDAYTETYNKSKQKWRKTSTGDERTYTFEAGKEYTIYRKMKEVKTNTEIRRTFSIDIQEGTD